MRIAGYTSGTKAVYYPQRRNDAGSKKTLIGVCPAGRERSYGGIFV